MARLDNPKNPQNRSKMKVSSVFNLMTDSSDVLDFFEGVESTEQLVSRLDRLKRQGPDELLDCLYALRSSIVALLDDTLEMSALGEPDDEEDNLGDGLTDAELERLTAEEKQNPAEPSPPEDTKT
jgi:hypothetical protein